MYIKHFGLSQYPFSLTPNTRFFLKLPGHQEAFNQLIAALEKGDVISQLVGEVGTGKTMLCRKLINTLEFYPERYTTLFLPNPVLNEESAMLALADEMKLNTGDQMNYRDLLRVITTELTRLAAQNKHIVLCIDEAQAIPEDTLKAIFLLTQIDAPNDRNLQLVLFGQPEITNLLSQPGMTKLQEQLECTYHLPKLTREETEVFVEHRLRKAGYGGPQLFSKEALDLIFDASQGILRLTNILSHKAMMVAYGKGKLKVTGEHVKAAMDDTETSSSKRHWAQRLFRRSD